MIAELVPAPDAGAGQDPARWTETAYSPPAAKGSFDHVDHRPAGSTRSRSTGPVP